jgi:hypothetical protein
MNESITRRGVLTGLGIATVAGGATLFAPGAYASVPVEPNSAGAGTAQPKSSAHADSAPSGMPTPIASTPTAGVTYKFASYDDFFPEDFSIGRDWSANGGLFTPAGTGNMLATFDLPTGAVLTDIEWYLSNSSPTTAPNGGKATVFAKVWVAGQADWTTVISGTVVPSATPSIVAAKAAVPVAVNGPFPSGTKLIIGIVTNPVNIPARTPIPTDPDIVINGVRVGYTLPSTGGSVVLLPAPVRAFDSRTGANPGKIHGGQSASIPLSDQVPAGATAAIITLTLTDSDLSGWLTAYATGAALPPTSSVNWYTSGQTVANTVVCAVSSPDRKMNIACGGASTSGANFLIDVVGYVI